jgi:phosphoribosylanthranilate isomerase
LTKIKICGLSRPCDIDYANELKPDYIGFVFAESKRRVSYALAKELKAFLLPEIQAVGVYVNEPIGNIIQSVNDGIIDVIQLHGNENEEYIKSVKALTNAPIIKAVSVEKDGDVLTYNNSLADYLLFDYKYGGTGVTFDWDLIGDKNKITKPYFLAGGLNPSNVSEAIKKSTPYAVDVSSGVEVDGVKSYEKMKEFVNIVRG